MSKVIALCCSDLHLCHRAPIARSAELDWYGAMARPLTELRELSNEHRAPVVIAGDIFDVWNAGGIAAPELLNFTIDIFDRFIHGVYAIPGNHDLPNHRLDEIHRSAFMTLIKSGRVDLIDPDEPARTDDLVLHAFPWGVPIKPLENSDDMINLAVVHAYIWREGSTYPGADPDGHVKHFRDRIRGYTASVFGDNHKGFMVGSRLMNCGTFMRRKSDEVEYKPMVGLLYDDGHLEPYYLDTSADQFLEESLVYAGEEQEADVSNFLQQLKQLTADPLDFRDAVNRTLDQRKLTPESNIRRIVTECLESKR